MANQDLIRLEELPPSGTIQLVSQRLRGTVAPLTVALIQAQAQGNPFFTEELVDALRESERLVEIDGVWTLSAETITALQAANCLLRDGEEWQLRPDAPLSSVDLGVPNSIQGVILSRLDRLPESVKPTSKVASVIGRLFEFDLLVRAHPLHIQSTQVSEDVNTLVERDFARIERPDPSLAYIFKHNITQEVAYNTLLENQRREIHQSVAVALEDAQPDAIDRLAFHFYNGDLSQTTTREKALHYLDRAATRAQRDYANETALSYLNRALQLEQRRQWLKAKVEVLDILGRREQQEETLRQLTELVGEDDFETLLLWGKYYESVSEYGGAANAINHGLLSAERERNGFGKAQCLNQLGMIAWREGNYDAAGEAFIASLSESTISLLIGTVVEAEAHYGLGLVYRQQGKYENALEEFRQDLTINQVTDNKIREARTLNALGIVALMQQRLEEAAGYLEQSLELRHLVGDRPGIARGMVTLAQILRANGEYVQADAFLRDALKMIQSISDQWYEVTIWIELGILSWIVGRYSDAENSLLTALQICQSTGHESGKAYVLLNLGQVWRDMGNIGAAHQVLTQGIALAKDQGDIDLVASYHSDLAILYEQTEQFADCLENGNLAFLQHEYLQSTSEIITDLVLLASGYLGQNDFEKSKALTYRAFDMIKSNSASLSGWQQRDYWRLYKTMKRLGLVESASWLLQTARNAIMESSQRITNPEMRNSFLKNVSYNDAILQESTLLKQIQG